MSESALPVFGVAISVAAERSASNDGIPLPVVFRECIDYVEECGLHCEGIYRFAAFKSRISALRNAYNCNKLPDLRSHEPHVASSLLKQFLRELPASLITAKLRKSFEDASVIKDESQRDNVLKQLLSEIPKSNKLALSWMIVHLNHVLQNTEHNKVTQEQLVTAMSPVLQMNHTVLSALLSSADSVFGNVSIVKYRRQAEKGDVATTRLLNEDLSETLAAELEDKIRMGGDVAASGEHTCQDKKEKPEEPTVETEVEEMDPEMKAAVERLRNYIERKYITEEHLKAEPDLKNIIKDEKLLIVQQEEMLSQCDELKHKCIIERQEIERLRSKVRAEKAKLATPDGGDMLPQDNELLEKMLMDYQTENEIMENKISRLSDDIHAMREACVDIRVQMRAFAGPEFADVAVPSLALTRALPDFDSMF